MNVYWETYYVSETQIDSEIQQNHMLQPGFQFFHDNFPEYYLMS